MNKIKEIAAYCREHGASSRADYERLANEWADKNGYSVDFFEGINVEEIVLCGECF